MRFPTVLALLVGLGCTTTQLGPSGGFEETLDVYLLSSGKKALALAADESGRKVFYAHYGGWSQKSAEEEALAECNRAAADKGVEAQCYLFASGDEAAPSTLRGCAAGQIGAKRCALQQQYPLGGD